MFCLFCTGCDVSTAGRDTIIPNGLPRTEVEVDVDDDDGGDDDDEYISRSNDEFTFHKQVSKTDVFRIKIQKTILVLLLYF